MLLYQSLPDDYDAFAPLLLYYTGYSELGVYMGQLNDTTPDVKSYDIELSKLLTEVHTPAKTLVYFTEHGLQSRTLLTQSFETIAQYSDIVDKFANLTNAGTKFYYLYVQDVITKWNSALVSLIGLCNTTPTPDYDEVFTSATTLFGQNAHIQRILQDASQVTYTSQDIEWTYALPVIINKINSDQMDIQKMIKLSLITHPDSNVGHAWDKILTNNIKHKNAGILVRPPSSLCIQCITFLPHVDDMNLLCRMTIPKTRYMS